MSATIARHSPDQLKSIIHDYFHRAYELGDVSAVDELIHPDVLNHGLSLEPTRGIEFFKEWYTSFRSSFSNCSCPVTHTWVDGDWVIVRVHFQGIHTGPGLGIAPTHKPVSLTALVAAKFENGKVVEAFNEFNRLHLLQQIGAG